MKSKYYIFIFFSFLLLLSCSKTDQTYTIEIKDGVRHVHNLSPAWGDTLKVALEFVQKIGELDTEDENYMLYHPSDISIDKDGNIYVLDSGNFRIQKYDPEGNYMATFGRKGQGPGEFEGPESIDIDADGNIYIADPGNNRVSVLSQDGKELRTFKTGKLVIPFKLLPTGDILTGTSTFYGESIGKPNKEYTHPVIEIFDKDGVIKKGFGKPYDYEDNYVNVSGNTIHYTFDKNNNIYVSFRFQNRVEKFSSKGTLLFTADRQLSFEITRPKLLLEEFPPRRFGPPSMNLVSGGIGVDNKGRIWVLSYLEQPKNADPKSYMELEIYDNDGILLGEMPWTEGFIPHIGPHFFGDRMFFIDWSREMAVYEYKIVEK